MYFTINQIIIGMFSLSLYVGSKIEFLFFGIFNVLTSKNGKYANIQCYHYIKFTLKS